MVLGGVEDSDKDSNHALGVCAITWSETDLGRGAWGTASEEGAGEIADGGYDDGKVVAAIPEPIV